MDKMLADLLMRLGSQRSKSSGVIPWSCPVPAFGDLAKATVATLGLNPSNREFVDRAGRELDARLRRLHTLGSLRLSRWSDATSDDRALILSACQTYFSGNPYNTWFQALEQLLSGAKYSYYGADANACHLDLIPFATKCKWTELTTRQRSCLLDLAGDVLGHLLRDSPVKLILLNGGTVVQSFQKTANALLKRVQVSAWTLPRHSGCGVPGYAYRGTITHLAGVHLERPVSVLGYNHNLQSSYGVTTKVKLAIRQWVSDVASEVVSWDRKTELNVLASTAC